MNCQLPTTGGGSLGVVVIAVLLVATGVAVLLVTRHRGARSVLPVLVLLAAAFGATADRPASAAANCPTTTAPANGWDGRHTLDVPVVVVTHHVPTEWVRDHRDAPFTFVTDGVRAAVESAQRSAGDRVVAVTGGTIARQCLEAGLLDEVAIDLVPVVMGAGRPFFGELDGDDVVLGDPTVCIQGDQVTHLVFPVRR